MGDYRKEEHARRRAEQLAQWRELSPRQKWDYFVEYYLLWAVVLCGIAAFVIYMIVNAVAPRQEDLFRAAVFDDVMDTEGQEELTEAIRERLGATDRQHVRFDCFYRYEDPAALQLFAVETAAGTLDAAVVSEEVFTEMAGIGYFLPLEDVCTAQELEAWQDRLFSAAGYRMEGEDLAGEEPVDPDGVDPNSGRGEVRVYGLRLDESEAYRKAGTMERRPVIGIMAETAHPEQAAEVLRFLMGE